MTQQSQRLKVWATRAFLLASVVSCSAVAALALVGSYLVQPANRPIGPTPDSLRLADVALQSESGTEVRGWFADPTGEAVSVLLLHPVRANRLAMVDRARFLIDQGYGVLLIDLQAHGESLGEAITFGWRERHDVAAAVAFLRQRRPKDRVVTLGWSLGGAAACLALPLGVDGLVLESVYPTIDEAIKNRLRMRVGPFEPLITPGLRLQLGPRLGVSPAKLRPVESLSSADCPLLLLAGDQDRHTTAEETRRMFHSAPDPKRLVWFEGAQHEDLYRFNRELWEASVAEFCGETAGRGDSPTNSQLPR